ncbi:Ribosomal-protein-S5p-alanine acetyltransferase [Bacillus cereus]|nr:Ribosomal-protein-S5p-alanine acetyltransferase [Bacillus cereus]
MLKKKAEGQVYPFGIFLRENDTMKIILGNCEDDYVAYFDKICS